MAFYMKRRIVVTKVEPFIVESVVRVLKEKKLLKKQELKIQLHIRSRL